jgi:hypothetical protein
MEQHDILWFIVLWLRIHGGDPGPEQTTVAQKNILVAVLLQRMATEITNKKAREGVQVIAGNLLKESALQKG